MEPAEVPDSEGVASTTAAPAFEKMKPRVEKTIRKAFGGRRVSPGTAVYLTAALEAIADEIVLRADERRLSVRKPKVAIERLTLIGATRSNPELAKLFRQFTFQAKAKTVFVSDNLLTKADRAAAKAKREIQKQQKQARTAVPSVEEE
jgi:hypothetical protein